MIMREIKFRLRNGNVIVGYERWNSIAGKWCYDTKPCSIFDIRNPFIPHTDKDRFTGLKDKNRNSIFEGDILLVPDELTDEPCNHLAPVTFIDGSFGVMINDPADTYSKGFWSFQYMESEIGDSPFNLEVIGNIYENPELIGG